jgi:hypothetical protein
MSSYRAMVEAVNEDLRDRRECQPDDTSDLPDSFFDEIWGFDNVDSFDS